MVIAGVGLLASAGACGDDDDGSAAGVDAGADGFVQPIPPFDAGTPPPEGVDMTGRLGKPVLVADVGKPVDGPSWRNADEALYFTVPNEAPTLRRLLADGGVEGVGAYDGGAPGPYGTASNGGSTLFVTEPSSVAAIELDADGGPSITRKSAAFELLGDIAVELRPDASSLAFFVDTSTARAYRYDPAGGDLTRILDLDGGGRATAIAVGHNDLDHSVVYVGVGNGATGTIYHLDQDPLDADIAISKSSFPAPGISPNGIAVDDQGYVLIAWARGIDVFDPTGDRVGSSPGLAIAAATNLAFGGQDRKTLYVTTATGKIYAVSVSTPGVLR